MARNHRVVGDPKLLLDTTGGDKRICTQNLHHSKGNLCSSIAGKFVAPACQQAVDALARLNASSA